MLTRRSALFGAAAAAAIVSAVPAMAQEESDNPMGGTVADPKALAKLPRVKAELVPPPNVMKHDQVAKGGPKIVEFQMTVHEKEIVIDDEGTSFQALTFEGSMPGPTFVVHEASLAGRPPESHVETAWTFLKHGIPMGFVEEVAMAVMLSDGLRPKRSLNMQSEQSWSI